MELTQTIQATCRVSAGLTEDGELTVKVFAQAEYAPGATTTAEVPQAEIPDKLQGELADVLDRILKDAGKHLGPRIGAAIHKSTEVAANAGEL